MWQKVFLRSGKRSEIYVAEYREIEVKKTDVLSGKSCGRFQNFSSKQSVHHKYISSGNKWQIMWQNKWQLCEKQI